MCSANRMKPSTSGYWDKIKEAANRMDSAARLVIGVGSGLSAAGGLNYTDPSLVDQWYPEYAALGLHTIQQIQGVHWWLPKTQLEEYWGFWSRHIWHIRYQSDVTPPYLDLKAITGGKTYFLITTNVDSQLEKAGFPSNLIFAPQGNYAFFQCSRRCTEEVYDNHEMIEAMVHNMPTPLRIRTEDIPFCPRCGAPLVPNLRCDHNFVERPHLVHQKAYENFLKESQNQPIVFLELGVGYNTPVIIRYPFETLTLHYPNAFLVRVNNSDATVPGEIEDKSLSIEGDLAEVLRDWRSFSEGNASFLDR